MSRSFCFGGVIITDDGDRGEVGENEALLDDGNLVKGENEFSPIKMVDDSTLVASAALLGLVTRKESDPMHSFFSSKFIVLFPLMRARLLGEVRIDLPFALIYLCDGDACNGGVCRKTSKIWKLALPAKKIGPCQLLSKSVFSFQ